jgi:hypothetical protein
MTRISRRQADNCRAFADGNVPTRRCAAMLTHDEDDYIDCRFEWPMGGKLAAVVDEQAAIARVQEAVADSVAEMGGRRRIWHNEYLRLRALLSSEPLSVGSFVRWLKRRRLKRLERIFNDLPERRGFATRDVHRKTHGCIAGRLRIASDIRTDLAVGLFQPGTAYDAVIRFSNGDPQAQWDAVPDARGMAVKLLPLGVLPYDNREGVVVQQRLEDHNGQRISPIDINRRGLLDIVTINYPAFFTNDPIAYAKLNRVFFRGVATEESPVRNFVAFLWSTVCGLYYLGIRDAFSALRVNGSVIYNPLFQSYWSMAPSRLGSRHDAKATAVKYKWEPLCADGGGQELLAANNPLWADRRDFGIPIIGWIRRWLCVPTDVRSDPDHLRAMVARSLDPSLFAPDGSHRPIQFSLKVQTFIDHEQTPVEDSSIVWLESEDQRRHFLSMFPRSDRSEIRRRRIAPFETVGVLSLAPLPSGEIKSNSGIEHIRNRDYIEDLSFNPWNNVPDQHRPLGIIQRMKRRVYAGSRNTRFTTNDIEDPFDPSPDPPRGPNRGAIV